ncbi:hypothetical protein KZO98_04060 [Bifidobacterium pseudocatenulatum]|nr:hypothetical protein [Bifidobacterium pseudocatenulatum]
MKRRKPPRYKVGTKTRPLQASVQAFKKYIPSGYVGLVSLAASILFGTIAIAATGGFDGTYTWGIVLAGVAGVAQTVYTLVNQALEGKLSKEQTKAN